MRFARLIILGLALALAACGGSSTATSTGAAATATSSGVNPGGPIQQTTATSAPASLPLKTGSVQVSGAAKTVLTTAQGLTIYYRTSDSGTSVFSGSAWPPVIAGSGTPTSSVTLPGKLAVLNDANGAQVTYNGHPLYTYAGDQKAGDATGQGIGNVWFVVTPDLS